MTCTVCPKKRRFDRVIGKIKGGRFWDTVYSERNRELIFAKNLSRFLYHKNDHSHSAYSFLRKRMLGGRRPPVPEILDQPAPVGAKSPILNRYSLVAPQP